jgi:hypothetical protein
MAFLLVCALNVVGLGILGMALVQKQLNQVASAPSAHALRMAA